MKKKSLKLISIMMMFVLILGCIPAKAAGNDGWFSISIGEIEGVQLEIYLLATGNYGDWTMTENFSDITVATRGDGSANVNKTLTQIRQRIDDRKIKPTQTGTSDKTGKVEFKNLTRGIYYVMMREERKDLHINPMLLSAPNKDGSVQIKANAKFEVITPTPSPTPTPKPTLTPYVPPEVTPTPTVTPPPGDRDETPTPKPTPAPTRTPAPPTMTPAPTPSPEPDPNVTPVPAHAEKLPVKDGETRYSLEDYETALGLGNIQIHVGVCFD